MSSVSVSFVSISNLFSTHGAKRKESGTITGGNEQIQRILLFLANILSLNLSSARNIMSFNYW